jgi:hypothetical protein
MNKKLTIGTVVVGVFLVAYYVFVGGGAFWQTKAYSYTGECTALLNSKDADELELFLKKVKENESLVKYSDISAKTIAMTAGATDSKNIGMGVPLKMCIEELKKRLHSIR